MARRKKDVVEISASEAKNAWHEILERVSEGREEVIVTRYGKPVMKLSPVDAEPGTAVSPFGWLRGTVTIHGDLVAPLDVAWDADA